MLLKLLDRLQSFFEKSYSAYQSIDETASTASDDSLETGDDVADKKVGVGF